MGAFGISFSTAWALSPFLGLQIHAAYGDGPTWAAFAGISILAGGMGAAAAFGVRGAGGQVGMGRFELPASRSQSERSDQAELHPAG